MIRLFIADPEPAFTHGGVLSLNPDQGRYLTSVMRLGVGDEISVFNGRDGEWVARLAEVTKKAVRIELARQERPQTDTKGPTLVVALIKRTALEYIIEKATELGVSTIQLVVTRRSSGVHTNVERLQSIATEAAEQTERLDVPGVLSPVKLDSFLGSESFETLIFGDEDSTHETMRETRPMLEGLQDLPPGQTAILIGPEGGFDADERAALRAMPRCRPVNLGPRILRADTAAISALTLYQAVVGDWR